MLKLLTYTISLYVCFVIWGYQQEKITSKIYIADYKWEYPFALNLLMGMAAYLLPLVIEKVIGQDTKGDKNSPTLMTYSVAGLLNALASPVGYASLKYISFPLMILTKSSKPIPVIIIGLLVYKKSFPWYKYVSVLAICFGIILFSSMKSKSSHDSKKVDDKSAVTGYETIIGVCLVFINLLLDGFTNNIEDAIFDKFKVSSITMMKMVNIWQVIYLGSYLMILHFVQGNDSEFSKATYMVLNSHDLRIDIALFCVCASIGQVLVFSVMKEFGSLSWIMISITRKLFTILISIFAFGHSVSSMQWVGVGFVFSGLVLESLKSMQNAAKNTASHSSSSGGGDSTPNKDKLTKENGISSTAKKEKNWKDDRRISSGERGQLIKDFKDKKKQ